MRTAEIEAASIVMIGSFNPTIFQPRWLGHQKLIRAEEAENAKITIIQAEVADFSTEWFQLQVLQNRLTIVTEDPRQYGPLRDLAAGIFDLLPHTPIATLGLSRRFHFKMPSVDHWHAIGHRLAPKEPWHEIMKAPGLRSMLMEGRREEASRGILYVKVEPSTRVPHGVFVEVHEEFKASQVKATDKTPLGAEDQSAQWVSDCLSQNWDSLGEFSERAAEQILGPVR